MVLALDIGGTNLRLGLVDTLLEVRKLQIIPSKSVYGSSDTAAALVAVIKRYIDEAGADEEIAIVAAGFPSLVDKGRRVLLSSTNFPGLDGVDIVARIEEGTGRPAIIDHDAYFILANDINRHGIKTDDAVLGFYFGTGMGNAMFLNGRPYYGKHGAACEVGHMPVALGSFKCTCGNVGCVEMYSCGKRLEGIVSELYPDCPISKVFVEHGSDKAITEFVRYMAVPIATEINIIDPEVVFVGGGVVYAEGFPSELLAKFVMENVRRPYPHDGAKIIFSENSPLNGLKGAALAGLRALEERRTNRAQA